MGMDTERRAEASPHGQNLLGHHVRQLTAVRIAQDDAIGARTRGGPQRGVRVLEIDATGVEEVLGIVDHFPAQALEVADAVPDHAQVFVPSRLEYPLHVQHGRLADDGHDRRLRVDQGPQVEIVFGARPGAAGHPERRHLGPPQPGLPDPTEELGVLGVRARPPALEVVDPELIQTPGDFHLVLDGKGESLALRTVAERRVVQHQLHRSPQAKRPLVQGEAA